MILVAGILALTSSLLTALGMAELFQGLFIIFLVIDLGRFLVLNFVVDEWKNLRAVKWLITIILSLLFIYSAVGVYNKLNSMIPESVQVAMVEAASYNKAQDNAEIKQTRSTDLASVAQSEYQKSMDWNTKDYENCMKRANGDADAENKCNNTKRRLDRNASNALKEAMKTANADLDNTQVAVDKNVKNQGEIAGVLTTVCRILPNTDCKTYEGLQTALTIIILLVICGLDYLQLSIVLAVNTRKNKKEVKEEAEKLVEVEKAIEIPKEIIKKVRKPRKKKEKIVKEEPIVEEIISEPVRTKPEVEQNTSLKKSKKSTTSFTQKTGFYK
jgi:hypothetical protein